MIIRDITAMTAATQDFIFLNTKRQIARVLLTLADKDTSQRQRFTYKTLAANLGTNWIHVHNSLKSLQGDGAIKIDRNRIIVKIGLLKQAAATAIFKK